jgi:hypothetical protein
MKLTTRNGLFILLTPVFRKNLALFAKHAECDEVDLAAEARALWSGETIEATDGLVLKL